MTNESATMARYLSSNEFYAHVKKRMQALASTADTVTLVTLDLDHFNYINDLFGYEAGDLVLEKMSDHFSAHMEDGECFSRIHADHFAFCMQSTERDAMVSRFLKLSDMKTVLCGLLPPHYSLVVSGGMIVVQDNCTPLSSLLDKANYARKKAKGGSLNHFLFYNEKLDGEVEWQKAVTLTMETSLSRREFEMYLQPKVLLQRSEIVGAEALVRWNSPQYGLVFPDRFIPIMEQNGFVCQLDFFILGEACSFLRQCIEQGKPLVPISVNFSKAHLNTNCLVEHIFDVVQHAQISPNLIEIEFTESIFMIEVEKLVEIVLALKQLGFHVSLDDFGSAYSSLNCLKDLPIDIVKIDKGFLNASTNTENGKLIIAKTVEMIQSLHKISVMEGVETQEQVDFLQKMSCDFAQGYFYGKPMPVQNFLSYLQAGNVAQDVQSIFEQNAQRATGSDASFSREFQLNSTELALLNKNVDIGLLKGYLDDDVTVQYINDRALDDLGYTRQEFSELLHNSALAFTHPDDVMLVRETISQLTQTSTPLALQTRAICKNGSVIVLKGRASCEVDAHGKFIGFYVFQDVTNEQEITALLQQELREKIGELESTVASERQMRDALRINEERYRVIMDQSDDIMFEWDFDSDFITFSNKYTDLFGTAPITESIVTNPDARSKIHPDDLDTFERWVQSTYRRPGCTTAQFRVRTAAGNYIWVRYRSTAIYDEQGQPIKAVGVFSNITAQKKEMEALRLKSELDPLTKLLNKTETSNRIDALLQREPELSGALFLLDVDNFKGLNDNLGHQMGDAVLVEIAHKLREIFPHALLGRIGGDEIVVYLQSHNESIVETSAAQLAQALRITYYGNTAKYDISVSIGIAFYPVHAASYAELYRLADIAMYESKRDGKDRFTVYHKNMTGLLQNSQTPVEWREGFLHAYFQNDFPFQVFQMLYETKDLSASIHMILELLGTRYLVDRAYIFQNEETGVFTSNTFEWCASGISSVKPLLQNMALHLLSPHLSQFTAEGVFHCTNVAALEPEARAIFAGQGIKALLHCIIYNEGKNVGLIGFDMCGHARDWTGEEIAILGYISRILSVFLIKTETACELRTSYQNYVEMLENLNGFVYVIDPNCYEVLYMNAATRSLGVPQTGLCYKIAFGADKPCPNCPINQLSSTVHYNSTEIYSELLHTWVISSASKLKWEGVHDAVLVCCTDISKYKQDANVTPC